MLIDHNNEETLPLVLATGCWAGHSIYPNTKMDEARMVALVKKYGAERILINSAADWGVSDPLKVPKTAALMRESGHRRGRHRDDRLGEPRAPSSPRAAGSIRGARRRSPPSTSASCSRATRCCAARPPGHRRPDDGPAGRLMWPARRRHRRVLIARHAPDGGPQRRRADPGARRRGHAEPRAPSPARARPRPLRTILPAVTCSVQSTFVDRAPAAGARHASPTAGTSATRRGLALAAVEPPGRRREDLGGGASGATPPSPARSCSGGTTCTARRPGR